MPQMSMKMQASSMGWNEAVESALSRNMSPTMISEYRTKLISKENLQKKLEKLTEMVDGDKSSQ